MNRERAATGYSVTYPTRSSSTFGAYAPRQRPRAEFVIICEDGSQCHQWVPPRVARAFEKDPGAFPRPCSQLIDSLHKLERAQCFAALTEMVSRRDHSIKEAHDKLIALGFRESHVEEAIARAERVRLLDDSRFALSFIDERLRRSWGKRKIELELRRRGIDPTALPDYPDAYFSHDVDVERAANLLRRKTVPQVRPFEKLVRFLVGKGFSYDIAISAVRAHLDALDDADGDLNDW